MRLRAIPATTTWLSPMSYPLTDASIGAWAYFVSFVLFYYPFWLSLFPGLHTGRRSWLWSLFVCSVLLFFVPDPPDDSWLWFFSSGIPLNSSNSTGSYTNNNLLILIGVMIWRPSLVAFTFYIFLSFVLLPPNDSFNCLCTWPCLFSTSTLLRRHLFILWYLLHIHLSLFFFFFSRDIGIFHFIIWHSMGAAVISFFWFHSSVCSVHTILTITTMG